MKIVFYKGYKRGQKTCHHFLVTIWLFERQTCVWGYFWTEAAGGKQKRVKSKMGTLWHFMLPWAILLLSTSPVVTIIKENNFCIWKQSEKVFLGNLIHYFCLKDLYLQIESQYVS